MKADLQNSRVDSLKNLYQPYGIEVDVLRLDLVHPIISGNKWFKLQGYLEAALQEGKKGLITFSGAYSNHIVATAAACQATGLKAVGIIRGEKPQHLSSTLKEVLQFGMELHFIARQEYAQKTIPNIVFENHLAEEMYLVAEGGYGSKGAAGVAALLKESLTGYTHILAAVGTGTTLAGLVAASLPGQKIIGISALKGAFGLTDSINTLLPPSLHHRFTLLHDYHFGGYAKHKPKLLQFMNDWFRQTGIPSDFVYTGKLFFAADHHIRSGAFERDRKLLLIHSGGLQGNRSLPEGTLIF